MGGSGDGVRLRNSSRMGWSGDVTAKSFFQRTILAVWVNGYGEAQVYKKAQTSLTTMSFQTVGSDVMKMGAHRRGLKVPAKRLKTWQSRIPQSSIDLLWLGCLTGIKSWHLRSYR